MAIYCQCSKIDLGVDIFAQAAACCYALGASGIDAEAYMRLLQAPKRKEFLCRLLKMGSLHLGIATRTRIVARKRRIERKSEQ